MSLKALHKQQDPKSIDVNGATFNTSNQLSGVKGLFWNTHTSFIFQSKQLTEIRHFHIRFQPPDCWVEVPIYREKHGEGTCIHNKRCKPI